MQYRRFRMRNSFFFQKLLTGLIIGTLAVQLIGCGTLLYPERRGQTSGNIDPGVAIMDGIGLFFFVIPGLVAYAIDFSTGAIYLPSKRNKSASKGSEGMRVVYANPNGLSQQKVEDILSEEMGYSVYLNREDLIISKLERPENILKEYEKLVELGEIPD
jgi:hypothetical protein